MVSTKSNVTDSKIAKKKKEKETEAEIGEKKTRKKGENHPGSEIQIQSDIREVDIIVSTMCNYLEEF